VKFKINLSVSALFIIILSELLGLFGVLFLRRSYNTYINTFDTVISRNLNEKEDIYKIQQLVFKHEVFMNQYLNNRNNDIGKEYKKQLQEYELKLRSQMIEHGRLMAQFKHDIEKYNLYRTVNDDILNYLSFNAVLSSIDDSKSKEEIGKYVLLYVSPLVNNVNESTEQLVQLSENHTNYTKKSIKKLSERTQKLQNFLIIMIALTFIISVIHCYKVFKNLEVEKKILKIKSEMSQQRITDMQHKTIIGIADLIESRSGETGQHVKRTSRIVNLILEKAFVMRKWPEVINESYIDTVTRAAPLHDVGKIVISDAILHKPGKLTDEEFNIMKSHAAAGGKILSEILVGIAEEDYVETAKQIASCHHEKWNGKGYPNGLKGEEIPLCARVMAIADVFDALISERCYKKPMSLEDAFELIKNEAGQHFDPDLVEIFMSLKEIITANAHRL